jgi:ElaB/YqjD/DUF883 family membrane-anchored ribosome-binding protein
MVDRTQNAEGPLVEAARAAETATGRIKDRIVSGAKDRLDASREYVSENPMKSLLIAAGVGALIGYLLGRRNS